MERYRWHEPTSHSVFVLITFGRTSPRRCPAIAIKSACAGDQPELRDPMRLAEEVNADWTVLERQHLKPHWSRRSQHDSCKSS